MIHFCRTISNLFTDENGRIYARGKEAITMSSMSIKDINLEDLEEAFEANHDIRFKYRGKEYFLTYLPNPERGNKILRCLQEGMNGKVLKYYDERFNKDTGIFDGKTLFDLAGEITILFIY